LADFSSRQQVGPDAEKLQTQATQWSCEIDYNSTRRFADCSRSNRVMSQWYAGACGGGADSVPGESRTYRTMRVSCDTHRTIAMKACYIMKSNGYIMDLRDVAEGGAIGTPAPGWGGGATQPTFEGCARASPCVTP